MVADALKHPGLGALALVVAAITFLLLATGLLRAFMRRGGRRVMTQEYRYRFYSVFSVMMFILTGYGLGYFLFPLGGLFKQAIAGNWIALPLLAISSVLPVLLLELTYTRIYDRLGFTITYPQTLESDQNSRLGEWYRHLNPPLIDESLPQPQGFSKSVISWLLTYFLASLMGTHTRHSLYDVTILLRRSREPKESLPVFIARKFGNTERELLQFAQDVLVMMTTWTFTFLLITALIQSPIFSNSTLEGWWSASTFLAPFSLYLLAFFVVYIFVLGIYGKQFRTNRTTIVLSFLLLLAGWIDYTMLNVTSSDHPLFPVLRFFGGVGPIAALLLLAYLGRLFVIDYSEFQERAYERLNEGMSANFLDRTLHTFGNALPSIEGTFRGMQRGVTTLESPKGKDEEARKQIVAQMQEQLKWGREGLKNAQQALTAIKSTQREEMKTQWTAVVPMVDALGKRVEQARCQFVLENPQDLTPELMVPSQQLRIALENLVDNATRELQTCDRKNPRIGIVLRRANQEEKSYADGLIIEVRDNGRGVPNDYREKIFEPYFSTAAKGMGIGLAMVRRFMTEIRGECHLVQAEQENNTFPGARFVLYFPSSAVRFSTANTTLRSSSK